MEISTKMTTTTPFYIRPATTGDVLDISNIARVSFMETYSPLTEEQKTYMNTSYSNTIVGGWVSNPNMIVYCCVVEEHITDMIDGDKIGKIGKIVGFAVLVLPGGQLESDNVPKKQAEVGKLYILSGYKRRGIGKSFIQTLEMECKTLGIKKLYLGVYHGNINAINFYTVVGFKQSSKPIMFSRNRRMVMNMKLYKKIKKDKV